MKSISEENGNILVLKEYWKKWIILRVLCIWNVNILFDPFYCSIMVDSHNICSETPTSTVSKPHDVEVLLSWSVVNCSICVTIVIHMPPHRQTLIGKQPVWLQFDRTSYNVWQLSNIGSTRATNVGHTQNRANSMDVCQTLIDRVAPLLEY